MLYWLKMQQKDLQKIILGKCLMEISKCLHIDVIYSVKAYRETKCKCLNALLPTLRLGSSSSYVRLIQMDLDYCVTGVFSSLKRGIISFAFSRNMRL